MVAFSAAKEKASVSLGVVSSVFGIVESSSMRVVDSSGEAVVVVSSSVGVVESSITVEKVVESSGIVVVMSLGSALEDSSRVRVDASSGTDVVDSSGLEAGVVGMDCSEVSSTTSEGLSAAVASSSRETRYNLLLYSFL